jgi:hypothetical protein
MNSEFTPIISSDGYLTSAANFAPYKKSVWESLSNFGKVGSSIKTGIKFTAIKPFPQQMELDGTTHTFEQEHTITGDNASPLRISSDGKRQLRDAISKFERISERMEVDNNYCFPSYSNHCHQKSKLPCPAHLVMMRHSTPVTLLTFGQSLNPTNPRVEAELSDHGAPTFSNSSKDRSPSRPSSTKSARERLI